MRPEDKAELLVNRFLNLNPTKMSDYSRIYLPTAKECALICVDEIIKVAFYVNDEVYNHYLEVKNEIEKL